MRLGESGPGFLTTPGVAFFSTLAFTSVDFSLGSLPTANTAPPFVYEKKNNALVQIQI